MALGVDSRALYLYIVRPGSQEAEKPQRNRLFGAMGSNDHFSTATRFWQVREEVGPGITLNRGWKHEILTLPLAFFRWDLTVETKISDREAEAPAACHTVSSEPKTRMSGVRKVSFPVLKRSVPLNTTHVFRRRHAALYSASAVPSTAHKRLSLLHSVFLMLL